MNGAELYHFLFETYQGIGVLVLISLVICIILAAILEVHTRKKFVDRGPDEDDDEWTAFDDDDDDEDDEDDSDDS